MRHFSLALAGVVAGSLALSAQASTTFETWWSEDFQSTNTYYDANYDGLYALTNGTYSALAKGVWTPGEGDASSIFVGTYSNGCTDVLNLSTEGTDLEFAPAPYAGSATSTNKVVVDADVFFVGSDSEPSNLGSDVQFALFLKVPEEVTASSSNAVMVYVRDTGSNQAVWLELPETNDVEDKSWHHVQVKIDYAQLSKSAQVYIDGNQKGSNLTLTLANNDDSAEGLSSVSFRGTGAVDNFVGAFEVEAAAITHTFTAAAYVDGSLEPSIEIEEQEGANGDVVTFEIPMEWVDSGTVTSVVTKICVIDIASGVTNEYTAASSFSGLDITDDDGYYYVDVEISGADDATAEYALLEVYYTPTEAPPAPTYTATITLPAGYTLSGVKVNNVVQDPVPSLPISGLANGDVVEFTYTNADGVSKTKSVTIADADATATTDAFTWADYLGAAVSGAYQIDDAADLELFRKGVAAGLATTGETFKQTADIDMSSAGTFAGIGGDFTGTYDGDGYTISNIVFTAGTYRGLFNKTTGATIKNLVIDTVSFEAVPANTEFGGSAFVGKVYGNTVLSNLTVRGSVGLDANETPCNHSVAGIATRVYGQNVKFFNCTNSAAVHGEVRKVAGILAIVQGTASVDFDGCVNSGSIVTTTTTHHDIGDNKDYTTGADGLAGIIAYANAPTTLKNCANTGSILTAAGNTGAAVGELIGKCGSSTVTDLGGNSGAADKKMIGVRAGTITGFTYATVDNGVATTVAAVAVDGSYLLEGNAAPVIALDDGESVEFDAALGYTLDGTGVTAIAPAELSTNVVGTVTTYTAAVPAPPTWTITFNDYDDSPFFETNGVANGATGYGPATDPTRSGYSFVGWTNSVAGGAAYATAELPAATANATYTAVYAEDAPVEVVIAPEDLGSETYGTKAAAEAAAASVTVGASAAVEAALDATELAAYKGMFEIVPVEDNGEWKLTAALTAAAETTLTAEATEDAGDLVDAGFTGNVEIDATPGFYYSIVWGTGVTNLGNETTRVLAEGEKVTLTMPANSANSGFYKVKISVKPE